MEEDQQKKFVCKFCNRRFSCGKALGGHIRTHMNKNSAEEEDEVEVEADGNINANNVVKFQSLNGGKRSKRDLSGFEADGLDSGYGLRENPRKTWRLVDSGSATLLQERVCKECGKGFQSLKALCGHMACHSDKEKLISKFEDNSLMDSHSDTETSGPTQLRRSKRMRYKAVDAYPSGYTMANGSSSVSGNEQEQEEVAKCLMMLSRDSGQRNGLNSLAESSDNNSVVLEAKSCSIDVKMKITMNNSRDCASNINEIVKLKKKIDKKLKSSEISLSDNSDSGYFRNGPKKAESDVSVDGSYWGDGFKKPKVYYGSGIGGFDSELGKSSSFELRKELINDEGYGPVGTECDLRMKAKNDSFSPEFSEGSSKKIKNDSSKVKGSKNAQKRGKYECLNCNMSFHSHRALGGHRASHTKSNGYCEAIYESGENSTGTGSLAVPKPQSKHVESCSVKTSTSQSFSGHSKKRMGPRKSKGHECPICFRVFRSGQALGGHKRSHFIGGSEERTLVLRQELPEFHGLIDLNLPAPIDEEANGDDAQFMPW